MITSYLISYIILILVLIFCSVMAKRSVKQSHNAVSWLESAIAVPILGNLLILSDVKIVCLIGYYIYYLGIDLVLTALVNFTNQYCHGIGNGKQKPTFMYVVLAADAVMILLNPFFGHVFDIAKAQPDPDMPDFELIIKTGLMIHHAVTFFILLAATAIFTIASVKSTRLYKERFTVILASIVIIEIVQAHYIFISDSHDSSVLFYCILGFLIFYFTICYRPLRLLDQMLSNIVSNLSDAFFIFDLNRKCIWANDRGCELTDLQGGDYEKINDRLLKMFGNPGEFDEKTVRRMIETENEIRYYTLEIKQVKAENEKSSGFYLRIQDITQEQQELISRDRQIGEIRQEAYKDALTGVGNKALYNKKVDEINKHIVDKDAEFAVVMIDLNNLKRINDEHGHKSGDVYIKGCCKMICRTFTSSSVFRIGGDEFAVILQGIEYTERFQRT